MPYVPMWICVARGYGRFAMSIHCIGPTMSLEQIADLSEVFARSIGIRTQ